jgi:hypothetical protein
LLAGWFLWEEEFGSHPPQALPIASLAATLISVAKEELK